MKNIKKATGRTALGATIEYAANAVFSVLLLSPFGVVALLLVACIGLSTGLSLLPSVIVNIAVGMVLAHIILMLYGAAKAKPVSFGVLLVSLATIAAFVTVFGVASGTVSFAIDSVGANGMQQRKSIFESFDKFMPVVLYCTGVFLAVALPALGIMKTYKQLFFVKPSAPARTPKTRRT